MAGRRDCAPAETLAALADAGCRTRFLDVCDESSMRAVVDEIEATDGCVGVLVNNAGYGLEGPVTPLNRQPRAGLAMDTIDMTFDAVVARDRVKDLPFTDIQTALQKTREHQHS